ncbi:LysR family transcriptional regulator [Methylomonas methanica]|uniref:Transcriptional regulator, LysR family n=1 Tax=Methylomonas methanica (strain DSM 25384 / MC09) TaxID=857087 RepID=F9ZVR1_METMM|nr:LysR family transcriptional regulator [Methylomonas methanica]AEF99539.1 transcriptional regulator, LysR family [Methylomonas methanica MC09]
MAELDWDDLKHFLALSRLGSVRAAADKLGVSHSTVARRIDAFEKRLGVRLFDRSPSGYAITAAGEEVLQVAEQIETEIHGMERRIAGRDQQLGGDIRVTMVDVLCTHLLMPHLAEFSRLYPDIALEVMTAHDIGFDTLDLSKREADVALRFTQKPPDQLIGKCLGNLYCAAYASTEYVQRHDFDKGTAVRWIDCVKRGDYPAWVKNSDYPHIPVKGAFQSLLLQFEAAKAGMGIGMLPCFLGDPEPTLQRLPPGVARPSYDLWLLTHTDMRTTARLRVFSEFIANAVFSHKALLEGRSV